MALPKTSWEIRIDSFKCVLYLLVCLIFVTLVSCNKSDVYTPDELLKLFKKAGFTPLPFPDSKYRPGSIISVDENGIRWVDDLQACRYPMSEFEEPSYIPNITFEKAWEFKGSALIDFKGVSAGPNFDKISKIRMEIKDHGADAFRTIKLKVWEEDPYNRNSVSQACMDELKKPNRYLISEAFRVSKGKYTFYDKFGASIKLETPILKSLLQFKPDVKYEITSDGSIVIEQPAYFAVRKAQRIEGGFELLGKAGIEPEFADSKIEQLFIKTHPIK